MSVITVSFTNNRWHILAFGLNVLFLLLVRTSCELEGGILPHFKVDHQAGKLKITASKDSADITYKNDNVDVLVKPNNKEQAKVILNSMKDNELGASSRSDSPEAMLREESGKLRSVDNSKSLQTGGKLSSTDPSSSTSQLHVDTSNDIGLRRSGISRFNANDVETEDHKENEDSDITWRGRINHPMTDEPRTDSRHVLSALSEIKNLMTLSMKPPNLKAFDEPLPDTNDKYLHSAVTQVKKIDLGQEKKRHTEDSQDTYMPKVKAIIHDSLQNNTYADEPSDFEYVQKAKEIIAQENQHHKPCTGTHCRHHQQDHPNKGCANAHCRHELLMGKDEPTADASFEDDFIGKLKDPMSHGPSNTYTSQPLDYDSDESGFQSSHRKSQHHHPYDTSDYHSTSISPYHNQGDSEFPSSVYVHNSMDGADIQGTHTNSMHTGLGRIFDKDFDNKMSDKVYSVNDPLSHNIHNMPSHQSGEQFHENDYLGDNSHGYDHMGGGFHTHGTGDYDLTPYHHAGQLTDLPEHEHAGAHHDYHDDDEGTDTEGHNREHEHDNYDFDEEKEVKDEDHETPDMVNLNGKLKDWYKLNAMGINPPNRLDEPMEGEIVLAANEKAKQESKAALANNNNKTKADEKKIESKFAAAGEKPLNSTEAEHAISKLNESLATGLNESTIKAVSSFDNTTDRSNKTATEALNSFNNIKLESMNNDSINIQKTLTDGEADNSTGTPVNTTRSIEPESEFSGETNSSNQIEKDEGSGHPGELKKKISSIEKKINSSSDLMKKLDELERKMNTSKKHDLTSTSKKMLSSSEKELLHITPEDVLQTHLPDEDFTKLHHKDAEHHNATMRALDNSTNVNSEKNETLNATSPGQVNGNETGSIESVYASIGEAGEANGDSTNHSAPSENKEEDVSGAGGIEDKHAEQKNHNEKDFEKYWLKLHKTKVTDIDGEKFGLLKRHKMKGYHLRRRSHGYKRYKTRERSVFKRHKYRGRYY